MVYAFAPVSPLLVPLLIAGFVVAVAIPLFFLLVSLHTDRKRQRLARKVEICSSTANNDAISKEARKRIAFAQQAAQRVRLFVSGGLSAVGFSLFIIGLWPGVLSAARIWPIINIQINGTIYYREHGEWHLPFTTWMCLLGVGPAMLLLGLLPTDHKRVRVASYVVLGCISFLVVMFLYLSFFSRYLESESGADISRAMYPISTAWFGVLCVLLVPAVRGGRHAKETRWRLARLWLAFRLFMLGMALVTTALSIHGSVTESTGRNEVAPLISMFVVFYLNAALLTPRVRRLLQRHLGDLGVRGNARSAAAIAALVGGREAADALAHGSSSFRGLPFAEITASDFASSADSGLHGKTVEAALGHVDAFVSHSWHDDAETKYTRLAAWAAARPTSPLVWLDKASALRLELFTSQ